MKLKSILFPTILIIIALSGGWIINDHWFSPRERSMVLVQNNPNLSEKTVKLLEYLYATSGKGILSGQHDYIETPDTYVEEIKAMTGKTPIIHGYELGGILDQSPNKLAKQRQAVVDSAIQWDRNGGIVTMMYHASFPGTDPKWGNVQRKTSKEEFSQIVTPGTQLNKELLSDLDEVAFYLKQLEQLDVPILWRPYHEMNGGWFWWGEQSEFSKLWNIMYERFTVYHQINNLIWVWNANEPNQHSSPLADYVVEKSKADILAIDIYFGDYNREDYKEMLRLADGRPIAIGESGEHPDPDRLYALQGQYVWFMTWGKFLHEQNKSIDTKNIYHHPYVLTKEDVNYLIDL